MDWKRKLSSRKFWAAVAGFITAIGAALRMSPDSVNHITSVVMALGVLMIYMLSEAYVDGNRKEQELYDKPIEQTDKSPVK